MVKRWWVMILLLVTVLVGCKRAPAPTLTPIAIASPSAAGPRSRGDTVVASGEVAPVQKAQLSFTLAGRVQTVAVEVGDEVQAGMVLARLEATELEQAVAQAEAALSTAQTALAQVKAGPRPHEIAAAQQEVSAAAANLTAAQAAGDQAQAMLEGAKASAQAAQAGLEAAKAEVAAAQAAIDAAEAELTLLKAGASSQQRGIAKLQIDQARNSLWAAQAQRDAIGGAVERGHMKDADLDAAEAAVGNAHVALSIAELAYEETEARPRPEEIAPLQVQVNGARAALSRAKAQVEAAQAQLDGAKAEVALAEAQVDAAKAQVAAAQARVAQAQAQLELLEAGPRLEDVALTQARVAEAEAALEATESALAKAQLVSPFAGTVTALEVSPGETVLPGQVVLALANLHRLRVETTDLSERDVDRVAAGQRATVYVEALGLDIEGRVVRIASQATTVGGDVVYEVVIELDEQPLNLRWGMSVEVEITTS